MRFAMFIFSFFSFARYSSKHMPSDHFSGSSVILCHSIDVNWHGFCYILCFFSVTMLTICIHKHTNLAMIVLQGIISILLKIVKMFINSKSKYLFITKPSTQFTEIPINTLNTIDKDSKSI